MRQNGVPNTQKAQTEFEALLNRRGCWDFRSAFKGLFTRHELLCCGMFETNDSSSSESHGMETRMQGSQSCYCVYYNTRTLIIFIVGEEDQDFSSALK
jgi:hypothetical protein